MYWSDWGNHPKIETVAMDGTLRETLVQDNIQWPTGEQRWVPGGARGVVKALTGGMYNLACVGEAQPGGSELHGRSEGVAGGAALLVTWSGRAQGGLGTRTSPGGVCPSGLAVDYHNERLYWADAKLSVIGSIRLNGTDPVVAIDNKKGKQRLRPTRAAGRRRTRLGGCPWGAVLAQPGSPAPLAWVPLQGKRQHGARDAQQTAAGVGVPHWGLHSRTRACWHCCPPSTVPLVQGGRPSPQIHPESLIGPAQGCEQAAVPPLPAHVPTSLPQG